MTKTAPAANKPGRRKIASETLITSKTNQMPGRKPECGPDTFFALELVYS